VAGFGISTPQQAAEIAPLSDGVVVGSAIVKLFEKYCGDELKRELLTFVRSLKQATAEFLQ
jgi:tryptophan synthase alpha chain